MQMSMENRVSAGFFVRLVAYLIDSLIAAIVVLIVKFPLSLASNTFSFLSGNFLFQYSIIDVISYLGVAAYFVLLTYFAHTTLGKMLFRLEVITEDGSWSFVNVLYRETIGRFLSSLLCIGYFAVIVTPNHRGFHDMLCDTRVVYKNMLSVSSKPIQAKPIQSKVQPEQPMQARPVQSEVQPEQPMQARPVRPEVQPEQPMQTRQPVQPVVQPPTYH